MLKSKIVFWTGLWSVMIIPVVVADQVHRMTLMDNGQFAVPEPTEHEKRKEFEQSKAFRNKEALKARYLKLCSRQPDDGTTIDQFQFLMERPERPGYAKSLDQCEIEFYTEERISRLRRLVHDEF